MSTPLLIELHHITHTYVTRSEAKTAIEDISLSVAKGEFVSIVGPSGCGKSTILSCIAGLIRPTNGEVMINKKKIVGPSPKVGYMLQSDYLFEWQTIQKNVLVGLKVMNKLSKENEKYANYLIHEMGLSEYKNHYPSQLSGGMRQRAALVRTLVTNPDILLLDEPFSALDYQTRLKLEDLVYETLKKHEKTAILVTHDIGESIAMSDKIIILDSNPGEIKEEVTVPEHIRHALPFHAREKEGYHELFRKIWKELDQDES
jgi:NitT/TauT family transport system ATP-binding protein